MHDIRPPFNAPRRRHATARSSLRHLALTSTFLCGAAHAASFDCLLEPFQMIEIGTPVTGLLERVNVRRGDAVTKGQIVAALESKAERAAVELAKFKSEALGPTQIAQSKIEFAQRKFERRKVMAGAALIPPQDMDDAEAELRLAQAELVSARENREQGALEYRQQSSLLDLRSIRSPIDGVVVDQMLHAGEMAEAGGSKKNIVKLAQIDPLRVNVILPGHLFGRVKMGMQAEVIAESAQGHSRHRASIRSLDKLIDGASGTFTVHLELPNKQHLIPAGAKCKADFPLDAGGAGKR